MNLIQFHIGCMHEKISKFYVCEGNANAEHDLTYTKTAFSVLIARSERRQKTFVINYREIKG